MQISYELDPTRTDSTIVNTLWFSFLVFSIAAAVNSLLGSTWKRAMYRSPKHRVPWWVLIWIKRSPLVFLVLSVVCFSIGLCAFSYASGQPRITSTFTTVLTALTSFGLAAVSIWFALERWVFARHRGQKLLSDVLRETTGYFIWYSAVELLYRFCYFLYRNVFKFEKLVSKVLSMFSEMCRFHRDNDQELDDIEAPASPQSPPQPPVNSPTSPNDVVPETPASPSAAEGQRIAPSQGKLLWKSMVRTVKLHSNINASSSTSHPMNMLENRPIPLRKGTSSSSTGTGMIGLVNATVGPGEHNKTMAFLEPTQELPAHTGHVKHIQFSPDGKYLATSSWDRTSVIFKVGDPFVSHRVLAHTRGFVGQVAWSPAGNTLLTKFDRGIKVWTAEDIRGNVLDSYDLGHIMFRPLTGLKPSKSRDEKRLVVYNLETKQVESQTPVWDDVRDITIAQARSNIIALISYENKAPPQLWKIELIKERDSNAKVARLTLQHTYMTKIAVNFAGPSYFGGQNNEFVLCAGKGTPTALFVL
ncbi:hypothetical protein EST38_g6603 [Candolleomyces aberdarensis]|uniref:Uncharacterized protein n=1 Tax=Candolleomyces aberdarensis TaxID=2316362 RepID=A0A4Q2DJH2_9AGAR|nr:hypothetical protein EST38_g6603 [Candolleomyces aberdarensis]